MTQASIFLVEDEALIRTMLVEMVEELGGTESSPRREA